MTVSAQSLLKPPGPAFDHLRSARSSYRLTQIERIRANGVGELIALPQLVVCGDQSAGKSSVLEGITGIPFPRHDGLCTRFPTEIILRHNGGPDAAVKIAASIRPHGSRTKEEVEEFQRYRKDIQDIAELPAIIHEVSAIMKIRGYVDDQEGCCFAPDVLRIEITGNTGLHLSVVDLPGLISVSDKDEDVDAVHNMVQAYLGNTRTIILAVLQASNDIENQPIVKLARVHDPKGERTVGIITKPDLVNKSTEGKLVEIANNNGAIKLKLGFYILKNPTPEETKQEPTMELRSRMELSFFSGDVWKGLNPERVGARKLRVGLQDLLDAHLERELPKVQSEIRTKLRELEHSLELLGEARPTPDHMRRFLTNLSMKTFQLVQAALEGTYHSVDVEFFGGLDSRLRAQIQDSNGAFSERMRRFGRKRQMGSKPRSAEDKPESTDETAQQVVSKEEMMQWVKQTYSRTRGKELPGTNNSALLSELFQEQSRRWASFAEDHVEDVHSLVVEWTSLALRRLVHEDHVSEEIQLIYNEWLANARSSALDELRKLLEDERRSPMTYNHYYTDNIQKGRFHGQKAAVKTAVDRYTSQDRNGKLHISNNMEEIEVFVAAIGTRIVVDMDEQACEDAISQLDSYYKVARKNFVDNVARQVIERHIIAPLSEAFWPNTVAQFSDEELLRIASEPETQAARRAKLLSGVQGLRHSLVELRRPAPERLK